MADDDDDVVFCCSYEFEGSIIHPPLSVADDNVDDDDPEPEFNVCVVPICCCRCCELLILMAAFCCCFCCCCSFNVVEDCLADVRLTDVVDDDVFDVPVDVDDGDDDDDTERPLKQRDNSAAARLEKLDTSADILPIVDNVDKQRLQLPPLLYWLRLMARNAANKQAVAEVGCALLDDDDDVDDDDVDDDDVDGNGDDDDNIVVGFILCGHRFFSIKSLSLYDDNNVVLVVGIFLAKFCSFFSGSIIS